MMAMIDAPDKPSSTRITAHLFCVRRANWRVLVLHGLPCCSCCGEVLNAETQEHAETVHGLLYPHRSLASTGPEAA